MNIGALGNANPLGVISQAMSGVGDMVKSAGSFIGNLAQMPPNLLGAIQDLCNVGNSVTQAMQGMQNATGLQMNPMEMLGNALGVGQQGGGGGQSPMAQMLDNLPSPLQMVQSLLR